jgi:hypothetical protein
MISREEYEKSRQIVEEYKNQCVEQMTPVFKCVICKTNEIKVLHDSVELNKLENGMWDGGNVLRMSFGYGSKWDCNSFYGGVCDDCIGDLYDNNEVILTKDFNKKLSDKGL